MKKIIFVIWLLIPPLSIYSQNDDYQLGLNYSKNGDYKNALLYFSKAAKKGNDKAQYELGLMYQMGRSVNKNTPEAIKWWQKSAKQGNVQALFALGWMYDSGDGVNEDNVEAKNWYLKAAEQGYDGAQLNLGILYADGEGVPQDYAEAFKWFTKASEQGNANAQDCLAKLYLHGNGTNKDVKKAETLFVSSAEKGNKNAMNNLGRLYLIAKDYQKAEMWLKKAVEKNETSPYPYSNLALLYAQRDENYSEALRYSDMALARANNLNSKKQASIYGERSLVYGWKGDDKNAEDMMAKCLNLNPNFLKENDEFVKMMNDVRTPVTNNTTKTTTNKNKVSGQTKHLTVLGIPITGSINTFQQKLIAKNYRLDTKENKQLPVGERAFKGRFSGHECSLKAYYFPDDKIVYKVRVSIDFAYESSADNTYKGIKRNLLRKYKYADTKTGRSSNGHESLSALIIDDEDDILGNIVLFVFDNIDPYESELVVGYEDLDGLIKAEKKNTDDL